jgi:hypothetical protein
MLSIHHNPNDKLNAMEKLRNGVFNALGVYLMFPESANKKRYISFSCAGVVFPRTFHN